MNLRAFLLLVPLIAACAEDTTPAASESTGTARSNETFRFDADAVFATRSPSQASCGEQNAPFADEDAFTLQAVSYPREATPETFTSIAVSFRRSVQKGVAFELAIGGPTGGATFEDAEQARSDVDATGIEGIAAFRRLGVAPKPLARAILTIVDVATKDGDPVSAHVKLEFADGDVLDETFTGALKSYEGACAAP